MRVAVAGGGISGLAAAYRIRRRLPDHELDIYEASARAGGLLRSERVDGFVIEHGPDSILTEKPWGLELAEELGLGDEIIRTQARNRGAYVVYEGRLVPIPAGFSMMAPSRAWPIIKSPILSWGGKARMAMDLLLPRATGTDDESLQSFVTRRLGRETFERLAQPLMSGIYGTDPAKLSLRATMPRFLEMEEHSRSVILGVRQRQRAAEERAAGARYAMFISFARGMQTLSDALAERLTPHLRLSTPLERIERHPLGGYRLHHAGGESDADAVIVALPPTQASRVLAELDPSVANLLGRISMGSSATISYAFRREAIPHPLDASGFIVPAREKRRIIASTWSSQKFERRAPLGMALIRVFFGGPSGADILAQDDDALARIGLEELGELLGVREPPILWRCCRQDRAMPQYHVGHTRWADQLLSALQGHATLALAGNAYRGVGVPDAVKSGCDAADHIAAAQAAQAGRA